MSYKIALVLNDTIQTIYEEPELPDYLADTRFIVLSGSDINSEVGYVKVGDRFIKPTPPPLVQKNLGSRITTLALLNRLGDEVVAAVESLTFGNTVESSIARVIKAKIGAATHIDLSSPDIIVELGKLKFMGLIDENKLQEIINTPVTEKEVYYK